MVTGNNIVIRPYFILEKVKQLFRPFFDSALANFNRPRTKLGAGFFSLGIGPSGPYFPALKDLWYGPAVYPTVTVILLIWLWAIIKYKLYMIPIRMIKQGGFPWTNLLLVFLSAVTAYAAEKHMHLPVGEELCELVAYIGLVVLSLEFKNIILNSKNNLLNFNKISYKKSI